MRRIIPNTLICLAILGLGEAVAQSGAKGQEAEIPIKHQERFEACTEKLDALQFVEAIDCFQAFVKKHPRSPLADEAYHDIALAQKFNGDLLASMKTSQRLIQNFRNSTLPPDAIWFVDSTAKVIGA